MTNRRSTQIDMCVCRDATEAGSIDIELAVDRSGGADDCSKLILDILSRHPRIVQHGKHLFYECDPAEPSAQPAAQSIFPERSAQSMPLHQHHQHQQILSLLRDGQAVFPDLFGKQRSVWSLQFSAGHVDEFEGARGLCTAGCA